MVSKYLHCQAIVTVTSAIPPIGANLWAFGMHREAYTHTAKSFQVFSAIASISLVYIFSDHL